MKNYYDILGIPENASLEEIQEAFRKLAQKFHPDRNPDDHYFAARFKDINEAKQILCDDFERAVFDMQLFDYNEGYKLLKHEQRKEIDTRQLRRQMYLQGGAKGTKTVLGGGVAIIAVSIMIYLATNISWFNNDNQQQFTLAQSAQQVNTSQQFSSSSQPEKETISPAIVLADEPGTSGKTVSYNEPAIKKSLHQNKVDKAATLNTTPGEHDTSKDLFFERELTVNEVNTILQQVQAEKGAKCVQVLQSNSSNIRRDFSIATVLQRNDYIISGRSFTSTVVQGAKVIRHGDCMQLIIGNFH